MRIEAVDPASAELQRLLGAFYAEVAAGVGYEFTGGVVPPSTDFVPPNGVFLVVRDDAGTGRGCGAVRLLDPDTAEIKRMWLDPSLRGHGAGRRLLAALEGRAVELGATRCVLDTHASLVPALALYRDTGWVEVPAYNDNADATHWFAKSLRAHSPG